MTSNLKIVRLRDLIKFNPQGTLEFAKLKEAVQKIASVPGAFIDYDVFIDTRGTESHLSATDIYEMSKDLAIAVHAGPSKGFTAKIAVLCPVEHFDNAEFFKLCAKNRGLNMEAFTSFDKMFDWLSNSSTPI